MAEPGSDLIRQIAESVAAELLARGGSPSGSGPKIQPCALPHGMAAAPPRVPSPPPQQGPSGNTLLDAGAQRVGHATENAAPPSAECNAFANYIDHTLLKPTATEEEVEALCEQAAQHRFASVCVNPSFVAYCARKLKGTGVMVCTVVGFPLGATTTATKVFETREAIANGADEIDMVVHIGRLKSGDYEYVCNDIRGVVQASQGRTTKIILETTLLTDDEKVAGCILSKAAGASFVKTSTGFGGGGATAEDVALMRKVVGADLGVKASGGIRSCDDAAKMVAAGANRLGASASVAIVAGKTGTGNY